NGQPDRAAVELISSQLPHTNSSISRTTRSYRLNRTAIESAKAGVSTSFTPTSTGGHHERHNTDGDATNRWRRIPADRPTVWNQRVNREYSNTTCCSLDIERDGPQCCSTSRCREFAPGPQLGSRRQYL